MKRSNLVPVYALLVVLLAVAAHGQASRTWVSGVGDDANPCSRTAPCKTFAGAISKTAAGGEISVLDPGGYGAVTITKSITINGEGTLAGILAAGVNGVVINAPGIVVTLRNLNIEGVGTGLDGIRFLQGTALSVEKTTISNFVGQGIDFVPSNDGARLFVSDSVIRNCNGAGGTDGAVLIAPSNPAFTAVGSISRTQLLRSRFGLRVEDGGRVTAVDTIAAGNTFAGFSAVADASAARLTLQDCVASGNQNGVRANGLLGAPALVRIAGVSVMDNTADGVVASGTGSILSFGNNRIDGNSPNGTPSVTVPQQ